MNKQPEALRLANVLALVNLPRLEDQNAASAELRHQHALIVEMREALAQAALALNIGHSQLPALEAVRVALAKAEPK